MDGRGQQGRPAAGGLGWFADPEGGAARRARVLAVEDGRRLVWEWWTEEKPGARSVVELTVTADAPGSSRLAVVERPASAPALQASTAVPVRGAAWAWRLAMLQLAVLAGALVG